MKQLCLLTLLLILFTAPAFAQLYVQNGGSLTLSDKDSYLRTNGIEIEPGGTVTVRGTIEWVNQATNQGTLVFQIGGTPESEDYGRMMAPQGDDIEFINDVVRTELVDGYTPEGVLSYPLITAGSLDRLPATRELPGPLWEYRFTDDQVFAEFNEAALPVEWLGFSGRWVGKAARLEWETAAEVDSDYFAVERQNAAGGWSDIGRVAAAGSSTTPNSYNFTDVDPGPTDPVLYRLRQVDYNGDFSYSGIVALERAPGETTVSLFPNPARDHIYVTGMGSGAFSITDAAGRELARGTVNGGERFRIELPAGLPVGTYFLRPQVGEARRFTVVR